jgi:hypothetical protein
MSRPRTYADNSPAARMRRSREALVARGERLVQLKLDERAQRALTALELVSRGNTRAALVSDALATLAFSRGFPVRLSREEEVRVAALVTGPFTAAAFRATGYADAFLAGLALAFATDRQLPRERLLALAREVAPEMVTLDGYSCWLQATPIKLARLFKLVDVELGIARAKAAA